MTRRILVTGASGFIGRHVLDALLEAHAGEMHAVNRSGSGPSDLRWHAADLRDPAAAAALVHAVQPTHLLHAAWEATPVVYGSSPENARWLEAGLAMLSAFGESGGQRFVGVGTSAEYAAGEALCRELATPILPNSVYGHAKAAMAEAAAMAGRIHGFQAAWGRLFLPFGPGDPPQRLLPSVLASIRRGDPVRMSDGLQERDFVFALDAGRMLARLLLLDAQGPFNIGSGEPRSIRSVVETLARLHGGESLLRFGAIERRPGEPARLVADMARYRSLVGDAPVTPLDLALRQVVG